MTLVIILQEDTKSDRLAQLTDTDITINPTDERRVVNQHEKNIHKKRCHSNENKTYDIIDWIDVKAINSAACGIK